ncbi:MULTISPECIES: hypothetical protein [unclassified Streptomyces]|uniref:hypothetical protein n=1 Tax=unclassified Streptomyces TaxID=2593676 RepID=UPI00341150E3
MTSMRPTTREARVCGTRAIPTGIRFTPPAEPSEDTIDWIAVERVLRKEIAPASLDWRELREAALHLRRTGVPRATVSVQLCLYERLVKQYEAEEGLLSPNELCTQPGCRRARAGRGLCAPCLGSLRLREKQQNMEAAA